MTNEARNPGLIPEQYESIKRLSAIFMPHATRHIHELFRDQTHARFVHYTSAESALNIIKTKRFWMRNTNCMSDYREVQHGYEIYSSFFSDAPRLKAFVEALDACAPGAAMEAIKLFDKSWRDVRFSTYIAAISEHAQTEDFFGRLSMWRAFGGSDARVGIVLNIPLFSPGAIALKLMFSPVAYLSQDSVHRVLFEVVENVRAERAYLSTIDGTFIVGMVFAMLLTGIVSLKHGGFHEEREWRAIYVPSSMPSELMESSTQVIDGIPQIIYKIPLDAKVSESLADLDLSRLFDRLIVGPTPYPWPMYEAFVAELRKAGVTDAENRLFTSDIPIRSR